MDSDTVIELIIEETTRNLKDFMQAKLAEASKEPLPDWLQGSSTQAPAPSEAEASESEDLTIELLEDGARSYLTSMLVDLLRSLAEEDGADEPFTIERIIARIETLRTASPTNYGFDEEDARLVWQKIGEAFAKLVQPQPVYTVVNGQPIWLGTVA